MKKWKTLICGVLAAALSCGLLSGCRDDGGKDNVLTIGFVEAGYGRDWLVSIADAFEASHPGITVELEGDSGMTQKIGTRLETESELCDIFMGLTTNWQQWAVSGYLEPLDDLYAAKPDEGSERTVLEKMRPEIRDFGKVNGKYYSVPWSDGVTGIVYNKKLFDDNGIAVPTTVSELKTACQKFLAKGVKPFVFPGQVIAYWDYVILNWWAQYEGVENFEKFYQFENADVYKQQGRLKALEVFEDLIAKTPDNYVSGSLAKNHTMAQMDFINGKAAMIPNGLWIETEMKKNLSPDFQMRMMPTPYLDGAKTGEDGKPVMINNTMAGDFFIVPKKAHNVALAKEFLRFMSNDQMLRTYTEKTGTPRPFDYDVKDVVKTLSPFVQSCFDIWEKGAPIYEISPSPLFYKNLCNRWPSAGAPYGRMISDGETALECYNSDVSFVNKNWDSFLKQVGLK